MEQTERESRSRFGRARATVRTRLIAGVAVLVPLVVTFLALRLVFQWLDGFAQPLIKGALGAEEDIPGLGIALTLVVVWVAGILGGNVVGRRVIGQGDDLIAKIPLIGSIYTPVKQFITTLVSPHPRHSFRRVVLAEYPSDGRWILGFATGEMSLPDGKSGRCVFVPTSPNPATGWMVVFPEDKVQETGLSVEEAMQVIVSGGIVIPEALGRAYVNEDFLPFESPPEAADLPDPPPTPANPPPGA